MLDALKRTKSPQRNYVYFSFTFNHGFSAFFVVDSSLDLEDIIPYAVIYPKKALKSYMEGKKWLNLPFWKEFSARFRTPEDEFDLVECILLSHPIKVPALIPRIEAELLGR